MAEEANVVNLPNLQVQLPIVKLTLDDLVYLRTLATGKPGCGYEFRKTISKLTFCGLIIESLITPPKDKVAEFAKERKRRLSQSRAFILEGEFDKAIEFIRWVRDTEKGLKPEKGMILTDAGRQLLKQGSALGKMSATGCPS